MTCFMEPLKFKKLIHIHRGISDLEGLIEEIEENVDHLECWRDGRKPSAAFCILYKLNVLGVNRYDLQRMQRHRGSPFVKALALLYIRFSASPWSLWKLLEPHLYDSENISLKARGREPVRLGEFTRRLLSEKQYSGLYFPRMKKEIEDEIYRNLEELDGGDSNSGSDRERNLPEEFKRRLKGDGEHRHKHRTDIKYRKDKYRSSHDDYNKDSHRHHNRYTSRNRHEYSRRHEDERDYTDSSRHQYENGEMDSKARASTHIKKPPSTNERMKALKYVNLIQHVSHTDNYRYLYGTSITSSEGTSDIGTSKKGLDKLNSYTGCLTINSRRE